MLKYACVCGHEYLYVCVKIGQFFNVRACYISISNVFTFQKYHMQYITKYCHMMHTTILQSSALIKFVPPPKYYCIIYIHINLRNVLCVVSHLSYLRIIFL